MFLPYYAIPCYNGSAYCSTSDLVFSHLLVGWALMFGDFGVASPWFANPFYIVSIIIGFTSKPNPSPVALIFSTLSLLFAIILYIVGEYVVNVALGRVDKIVHFDLGYYVWFASFFCMFLSQVMLFRNSFASNKE